MENTIAQQRNILKIQKLVYIGSYLNLKLYIFCQNFDSFSRRSPINMIQVFEIIAT